MDYIIVYLECSRVELAEKLLGRKLTAREKMIMYHRMIVSTKQGAERMIEHLRLTDHIAYIEND